MFRYTCGSDICEYNFAADENCRESTILHLENISEKYYISENVPDYIQGSEIREVNNFAIFDHTWIITVRLDCGYDILQYASAKKELAVIDFHVFSSKASDQADEQFKFHHISKLHEDGFLVTAYAGIFHAYQLHREKPATKEKTYLGHNTTIRLVRKAEYIHHGKINGTQKYAIVSVGNDRSMRVWNPSDPWAIDVIHGQYSGVQNF